MKQTDMPKTMEKLYRAKHLKKAILKLDEDFLKKLEFMGILTQAAFDTRPVIPDLDLISEHYGKLSAYLHASKDPEDTVDCIEWWDDLKQLLSDSIGALRNIHATDVGYIELNEMGLQCFEEWNKGDLNDNDVIRTFEQTILMWQASQG